VVYARGGIYAEDSVTPASHFDHQKGYFDFWLNFVGVKEVRSLVVESTTWGGKEKGKKASRGARRKQRNWRRTSRRLWAGLFRGPFGPGLTRPCTSLRTSRIFCAYHARRCLAQFSRPHLDIQHWRNPTNMINLPKSTHADRDERCPAGPAYSRTIFPACRCAVGCVIHRASRPSCS
jgi:Flavodoxin-like fold